MSVKFDRNYAGRSKVQSKQNKKLALLIPYTLRESNYHPDAILEIGGADGELAYIIQKRIPGTTVYNLDISEDLIKIAREKYPEVKHICADFFKVTPEELGREKFQVIYSSNTFHWFPLTGKKNNWKTAMQKVYSLLESGGFFFLHQGGAWSYFPLYELANTLYEKKYKRRVNLNKYLYYPTLKQIEKQFKKLGFVIFSLNSDYEFLGGRGNDYGTIELYESFSVAGLSAVLSEVPEKDKERFRKEFLHQCKIHQPPVFAHRIYAVLRKPFSREEILIKEETVDQILPLLEEVSDEFVPPLHTRTPDDNNLNDKTSPDNPSGIHLYAGTLAKNYKILALFAGRELACFLAYKKTTSIVNPDEKVLYVSTIATRKKFRKLGLAHKLYEYFLNAVKYNPEIKAVETRTWHTNLASIKLLKKLKFKQVKRLKNHRGKGIHTLYFRKNLR